MSTQETCCCCCLENSKKKKKIRSQRECFTAWLINGYVMKFLFLISACWILELAPTLYGMVVHTPCHSHASSNRVPRTQVVVMEVVRIDACRPCFPCMSDHVILYPWEKENGYVYLVLEKERVWKNWSIILWRSTASSGKTDCQMDTFYPGV